MDKLKKDLAICKAYHMAIDMIQNYSWDKYRNLWDFVLEWNDDHYEDESMWIFMCETSDDDDNVNGIMIEDTPFYFKED